jgi:hypothetical protein
MKRTSKVWLLLAMLLLPRPALLAAEAEGKADEKYTLRHVLKDGQVIRGEVCQESVIGLPGVPNLSTTKTTEILLRNVENDHQGKLVVSMIFQNIRIKKTGPDSFEKIDFDSAKGRDTTPESPYCLLVGREFKLEIDPQNRISVIAGLDDYLAAIKETANYKRFPQYQRLFPKKGWEDAFEQMLSELNAYLPSHPVSI